MFYNRQKESICLDVNHERESTKNVSEVLGQDVGGHREELRCRKEDSDFSLESLKSGTDAHEGASSPWETCWWGGEPESSLSLILPLPVLFLSHVTKD